MRSMGSEGSPMPDNSSRRARYIGAVLAMVPSSVFLLSTRAVAAPSPSPTPSPSTSNNPCDLIYGAARDYRGGGKPSGPPPRRSPTVTDDALDPLTSLARGCADAASWTVGKLSEAVEGTATVDFTNERFL